MSSKGRPQNTSRLVRRNSVSRNESSWKKSTGRIVIICQDLSCFVAVGMCRSILKTTGRDEWNHCELTESKAKKASQPDSVEKYTRHCCCMESRLCRYAIFLLQTAHLFVWQELVTCNQGQGKEYCWSHAWFICIFSFAHCTSLCGRNEKAAMKARRKSAAGRMRGWFADLPPESVPLCVAGTSKPQRRPREGALQLACAAAGRGTSATGATSTSALSAGRR